MAVPHNVCLRSDFLVALRNSHVEVVPRRIEDWLIKQGIGAKRGCLAKLLKGGMHRPIYIAKLVRYLKDNTDQGEEQRDRRALNEFLLGIGKPGLLSASTQTIAEALYAPEPDVLGDGTNRFLLGDWIRDYLTPKTYACSETDLVKAIDWMTRDFASQIVPHRKDMTMEYAENLLREHGHITRKQFREAVQSWQRFDQWTCVIGRHKKQLLGMSVMLPLKLEAYMEFRNGLRHTCDFTADDLERPSRFLIMLAITPNHAVRGMTPDSVVDKLVANCLHQAVMLSYADGHLGNQPLHVTSFGCTKKAEDRLKSDKYDPVGTFVSGTKMPIFERKFTRETFRKRPIEASVTAALDLIGKTTHYQLSPAEIHEANAHPDRPN